jgi:hypothetical protein
VARAWKEGSYDLIDTALTKCSQQFRVLDLHTGSTAQRTIYILVQKRYKEAGDRVDLSKCQHTCSLNRSKHEREGPRSDKADIFIPPNPNHIIPNRQSTHQNDTWMHRVPAGLTARPTGYKGRERVYIQRMDITLVSSCRELKREDTGIGVQKEIWLTYYIELTGHILPRNWKDKERGQ